MSEQPDKTPNGKEPSATPENAGSATPPANSNDNKDEGAVKKEAPKPPPTVEEMQQQVADMLGSVMRARRETLRAEAAVKAKDAELAELRRTNGLLQTQVTESKAQGFEKFARELLNVADNLERALSHLPEKKLEDLQVNALATGVNLTAKQLTSTFNKFGIAKIDAAGKEFDPAFHEAVMTCDKDGVESGHIVEVLQSGYTLNGKLLRPARVSVAP